MKILAEIGLQEGYVNLYEMCGEALTAYRLRAYLKGEVISIKKISYSDDWQIGMRTSHGYSAVYVDLIQKGD